MTEPIRGRERDRRKEVCREVQLERARASCELDPQRQTPRAKINPGGILLKADAGEAGEGWSDSRIAAALDTGLATIARVRQQLVEEGFDSALTPKRSPASARPRIFDGAGEAKLIALACSEPPKGRARWTLSLLEDMVVELNIVDRASDNTIARTLKKT